MITAADTIVFIDLGGTRASRALTVGESTIPARQVTQRGQDNLWGANAS